MYCFAYLTSMVGFLFFIIYIFSLSSVKSSVIFCYIGEIMEIELRHKCYFLHIWDMCESGGLQIMRTPLCFGLLAILCRILHIKSYGSLSRCFCWKKKDLRLRKFARWLGLSMPECSGFFLTYLHTSGQACVQILPNSWETLCADAFK